MAIFRFKFQCPLCEVKYKSRSGFNSHRKLHVDRVENGDIDSIKRESVIHRFLLTTNSVTVEYWVVSNETNTDVRMYTL